MAQAVISLNPSVRVDAAWAEVRKLRRLRAEIEEQLIAAEAVLDVERQRETPGGDPLLTVQQAALQLSVSESMLWKAIRAGQIAVTKIGRNTRITEAELRRYVEAQ